MFQTKMKQHTQQIINHIKEGKYQLKKIKEEKRDSFRQKKVKKLCKKIEELSGKSTKAKMLLLFELEKNLEEEYTKGGNKINKTIGC